MDEERLARLACHHLHLSSIRLGRALTQFGGAEALLVSHRDELSLFFQPKDIVKICGWQGLSKQEQYREIASNNDQLASLSAQLIANIDEYYPSLLKEISDPPPLLYVQGDLETLKQSQIAIVGSRRFTPNGGSIAAHFSGQLAKAGITITSGLALGIDACAHEGALKAGGNTIAVLGTGIDRRYPRANNSLYDQILTQGGAIVSEYPLGTPPRPENFPRRNRIITGLSMGTLVVEASLRSGSLVSARLASEQGRQVFAVPGSIRSSASEGCHLLIREGATLVTAPEQVLEDIGSMLSLVVSDDDNPYGRADDSPPAHWLLALLGGDILSIDEICDRSAREVQEVIAVLTDLEMRGEIIATDTGYQRR